MQLLAARRTSLTVRRVSRVLDGWPCVTSWSPLLRLDRDLRLMMFDEKKSLILRCRFVDEGSKGNGAGLLLRRPVSGVKKKAKRGVQRLVVPKPVTETLHPRPCAEDVLCRKGFLSTGQLTDNATGIAVDENKNERGRFGQKKNRYVCFEVEAASRKKRTWPHDLLQTTETTKRRSPPEWRRRSSRAWLAAQKPTTTVKISFLCFASTDSNSHVEFTCRSVVIAFNDATSHERNGAPKNIGRKVEKSFRSALQNTVKRVSRSRDPF